MLVSGSTTYQCVGGQWYETQEVRGQYITRKTHRAIVIIAASKTDKRNAEKLVSEIENKSSK